MYLGCDLSAKFLGNKALRFGSGLGGNFGSKYEKYSFENFWTEIFRCKGCLFGNFWKFCLKTFRDIICQEIFRNEKPVYLKNFEKSFETSAKKSLSNLKFSKILQNSPQIRFHSNSKTCKNFRKLRSHQFENFRKLLLQNSSRRF